MSHWNSVSYKVNILYIITPWNFTFWTQEIAPLKNRLIFQTFIFGVQIFSRVSAMTAMTFQRYPHQTWNQGIGLVKRRSCSASLVAKKVPAKGAQHTTTSAALLGNKGHKVWYHFFCRFTNIILKYKILEPHSNISAFTLAWWTWKTHLNVVSIKVDSWIMNTKPTWEHCEQ